MACPRATIFSVGKWAPICFRKVLLGPYNWAGSAPLSSKTRSVNYARLVDEMEGGIALLLTK